LTSVTEETRIVPIAGHQVALTLHEDDLDEPRGELNVWGCWSAPLGNATHRLLLEDDMIPCEGFLAAIVAALDNRPELPVAAFAGRSRLPLVGLLHGHAWAKWKRFLSGGAMLLPRHYVEELVSSPPTGREGESLVGVLSCDRLVNQFLEARRGRDPSTAVHFLCPSLLDHDVSLASLTGHNGRYPPRSPCWLADRPAEPQIYALGGVYHATAADVRAIIVDIDRHNEDPDAALFEATESLAREIVYGRAAS
jgi:hypothetical protein